MNELQRQAYLQAMEVDYYIPRLQLPGALPSVLCQIPAVVAMSGVVDRKESATSKPAIARQINNPGDSRVAALQAMLGDRPSALKQNHLASSSPGSDMSTVAVGSGSIPLSHPRFSLSIIRGQSLLIIDEGLPGHINPNDYLQLLHNILFAVGAGKQQLSIDTFVWPMAKNSLLDQSEMAARQTLISFLSKQITQLDARYILLMGNTAANYIAEQTLPVGVLQKHSTMPVQLIRTYSAGQVLSDTSLKAQLWQQLNALYQALK